MPRAGIFGSARVGGGGASLTGGFLQMAEDTADLTTYTFASQNLGTASADREILIVATGRQSSSRTISSVTVGGVSATTVVAISASQNPIGIYKAAVPSGTTGDVVVTFSGAMLRAAIGAWAITGGISAENTQSGVDTTLNVTGYTGGFIIAAANVASSTTFTWTGVTERYDEPTETFTSSGGDATTVGSVSITATPAAGSSVGVVAAALAP